MKLGSELSNFEDREEKQFHFVGTGPSSVGYPRDTVRERLA